jgi:hypothetical protein
MVKASDVISKSLHINQFINYKITLFICKNQHLLCRVVTTVLNGSSYYNVNALFYYGNAFNSG